MEACVWQNVQCGYKKLIRNVTGEIRPENIFNPDVPIDKDNEEYRKSMLEAFDGFGTLVKGAELYHSTSSPLNWWKTSLPKSTELGGVFFSTDVDLSISGGKAPLGVTLSYTIMEDSPIVLPFIKSRSETFQSEEEEPITLVGDDIAKLMVPLGFWGYFSCDECEVFMSNELIEKLIVKNSVKIVQNRRNSRPWMVK